MNRIAIFQLGYEANTFIEGRAELEDLGMGGWIPGSTVENTFSGGRADISGILSGIKDSGAVAVPLDLITRAGTFNAGPKMGRQCVIEAVDHVCAELLRRAEEYDGVCIAMHGAGCADGFHDADGYLLKRVRQVVGDKPVMASLDLHGNITEEMVAMADGLFGIKTNPHVDCYEAGYRAASILAEYLSGRRRPCMALRRIPLLIPLSHSSTMDGAAKKIKEYIEEYVHKNNLIDATFFHGFAGADTPYTCASVLVVGDGYTPNREAEELADYIWKMRAEFVKPSFSAEEAIEQALKQVKNGYVVINEGSDNPGAGCPGDGTHLLREMIRRNLPGSIMGPVFDPIAASVCHEHRIGDRFPLEVGGRTHPAFGEPLSLEEVELLALSDGEFVCASPVNQGARMHYGPSARLRCGKVQFIVVSQRFQTYDDRPFLMTKADMREYSIVALKSTNHFRAYFRSVADAIVSADTPSVFPADVRKLPYQYVQRPIYPLDQM